MKISILTLFPEMFLGPFDHSIIKRAQDKNILSIEYINIRNFGLGKHKIVDDAPYGGGVGMIMRVDVVAEALEKAKCPARQNNKKCRERIILLDPQGKKFEQKTVKELSNYDHLILICGHYEGIDERIREFIDEEISIGDYVLTGGELAAVVITDAVTRLLPNVLGKEESAKSESFEIKNIEGKNVKLLECPQYTRPNEYKGLKVPEILLSGNHKEIENWREKEAFKKTKSKRPDLLSTE